MIHLLKNLALVSFAVSMLNAQTPAFEVASIKPCGSGDVGGKNGGARGGGGGGEQGPSPDRLTLTCQPVRQIIRMAYLTYAGGHRNLLDHLPPIEGGPSWINERYQITAKAEGAPGQDMMRGPMLQALLEDRLKVKVHRETREVPVYALTVAKNGPKLQPFVQGTCAVLDFSKPPFEPTDRKPFCAMRMLKTVKPSLTWEVHGGTLDDLANSLGLDLDRIVINKTGIEGKYDFHLEFAADQVTTGLNSLRTPDGPLVTPASPTDPPGGVSIFTAIQQQLGLKLESAKGPREFFVIDRVEKPTEN